jgi:hypothetical protein
LAAAAAAVAPIAAVGDETFPFSSPAPVLKTNECFFPYVIVVARTLGALYFPSSPPASAIPTTEEAQNTATSLRSARLTTPCSHSCEGYG